MIVLRAKPVKPTFTVSIIPCEFGVNDWCIHEGLAPTDYRAAVHLPEGVTIKEIGFAVQDIGGDVGSTAHVNMLLLRQHRNPTVASDKLIASVSSAYFVSDGWSFSTPTDPNNPHRVVYNDNSVYYGHLNFPANPTGDPNAHLWQFFSAYVKYQNP